MKTKLFSIILIIILLNTGCVQDNNEKVITPNSPIITSINNDEKNELLKCNKENEYLKEQNIKLKEDVKKLQIDNNELLNSIANSNKLKNIFNENDFLQSFNPNTQWDEIIISNGTEEVSIKDNDILANVGILFFIEDMKNLEPVSSRNRYTYNYTLIKNEREIVLEILYDNIIKFNNVENKVFTSSRDISQLGKAFLKQPEYYPEDSIFTQMINSGMYIIKNESESYNLITFNSFLIQHTIDSFLKMEKNLIEKDIFDSEKKTFVENWEFYTGGKIIYVDIYTNLVKITADNQSYFYKISNKEDMQQLLYLKNCY